jgi:hypothetical protein
LRVSDARAVADRLGQAPGVSRSRMRDDSYSCHLELSFHWSPSRLRSDVMLPTTDTNTIMDDLVPETAAVEASLWADVS